jgi:indole-3-glycerol phosphate synthase
MTNNEIAGLLRDYKQMKQAARGLRMEMLRVAVEELGMEQNEALQANLEVFLDGYLVGQGMMRPWRKTGT